MNVGGLILFFIGSVLIQQEISPVMYAGLVCLYIAIMFMNLMLEQALHESHVEELDRLRISIDLSIKEMKEFVETTDSEEINENDFIKRSEQKDTES